MRFSLRADELYVRNRVVGCRSALHLVGSRLARCRVGGAGRFGRTQVAFCSIRVGASQKTRQLGDVGCDPAGLISRQAGSARPDTCWCPWSSKKGTAVRPRPQPNKRRRCCDGEPKTAECDCPSPRDLRINDPARASRRCLKQRRSARFQAPAELIVRSLPNQSNDEATRIKSQNRP